MLGVAVGRRGTQGRENARSLHHSNMYGFSSFTSRQQRPSSPVPWHRISGQEFHQHRQQYDTQMRFKSVHPQLPSQRTQTEKKPLTMVTVHRPPIVHCRTNTATTSLGKEPAAMLLAVRKPELFPGGPLASGNIGAAHLTASSRAIVATAAAPGSKASGLGVASGVHEVPHFVGSAVSGREISPWVLSPED